MASAVVPYQGREVPISRSQFPSFPVILRHYRLCTTDDTQSSQISKHVKKGWETGILGVTLGADISQIPVFASPLDPLDPPLRPPGSDPWIRPGYDLDPPLDPQGCSEQHHGVSRRYRYLDPSFPVSQRFSDTIVCTTDSTILSYFKTCQNRVGNWDPGRHPWSRPLADPSFLRSQFPTFPVILWDYRVYHRPHKSLIFQNM